ncbi:Protein of unknown function (DUF1643) [Photorhabdus khanii NC19]|uniref:Uncharacterized protein n=1 Tax=Photorhabdus khanii NC19 TaxID=1004151 RepID=W3VA12_9GAMM|nr:Protein of unknown function (DUF1643) [Photorhabdus khanii NC19]
MGVFQTKRGDILSAIISKCGMYRYRLERDVQPEGLVFGYFGVNGSTATATEDDHTVRKWIGFTKVYGGRRFIVVMLLFFGRPTFVSWLRRLILSGLKMKSTWKGLFGMLMSWCPAGGAEPNCLSLSIFIWIDFLSGWLHLVSRS